MPRHRWRETTKTSSNSRGTTAVEGVGSPWSSTIPYWAFFSRPLFTVRGDSNSEWVHQRRPSAPWKCDSSLKTPPPTSTFPRRLSTGAPPFPNPCSAGSRRRPATCGGSALLGATTSPLFVENQNSVNRGDGGGAFALPEVVAWLTPNLATLREISIYNKII